MDATDVRPGGAILAMYPAPNATTIQKFASTNNQTGKKYELHVQILCYASIKDDQFQVSFGILKCCRRRVIGKRIEPQKPKG
jgi:hypothetical protein